MDNSLPLTDTCRFVDMGKTINCINLEEMALREFESFSLKSKYDSFLKGKNSPLVNKNVLCISYSKHNVHDTEIHTATSNVQMNTLKCTIIAIKLYRCV